MKFGIHLDSVSPKIWSALTKEADRLRFESVWVPEHVVVPLSATGSPHDGDDHPTIPSNVPIYDAMVLLAHLGAQTENIRLGTQVYNIGLRHPFITARAATTTDLLTNG